jgi:hypothetical protein
VHITWASLLQARCRRAAGVIGGYTATLSSMSPDVNRNFADVVCNRPVFIHKICIEIVITFATKCRFTDTL